MLTKKQEALIRMLATRHGRRNSDLCLVEGLRAAGEAVALKPESVEWCILRSGVDFPAAPRDKTVILEPAEFAGIAPTVNSQGIMAVVRRPEWTPLTEPLRDPFVLLLDRIADPGNFGTILRTARAAGLSELWTVKGGVDPFGDKAVRSGMGAQFAMGIRCAESLEEAVSVLKSLGVASFYRTEPAEGRNIFTEPGLFGHSAVVLGNEACGAGEIPGALPLNIPMPGSAESLNVAQAATVVLFEYVRRSMERPQ